MSLIPARKNLIAPVLSPIKGFFARLLSMIGFQLVKTADVMMVDRHLLAMKEQVSTLDEADLKLRELLREETARADANSKEASRRARLEADADLKTMKLLEVLAPLGIPLDGSFDSALDAIEQKMEGVAFVLAMANANAVSDLSEADKVKMVAFVQKIVVGFIQDTLENGEMAQIDNPSRKGPAENYVSFFLTDPKTGEPTVEVVIQRLGKMTPEQRCRKMVEALSRIGVTINDPIDRVVDKINDYVDSVEQYAATNA